MCHPVSVSNQLSMKAEGCPMQTCLVLLSLQAHAGASAGAARAVPEGPAAKHDNGVIKSCDYCETAMVAFHLPVTASGRQLLNIPMLTTPQECTGVPGDSASRPHGGYICQACTHCEQEPM